MFASLHGFTRTEPECHPLAPAQEQSRTSTYGPDRRGRGRTGPDARPLDRTFSLLRLGFLVLIVHFGLLIRGLGVQVPRGAPVIKALTWSISPVRGLLHVHSGRLGARWVLGRRWTVLMLAGCDGTARTGRRQDPAGGTRGFAGGRAAAVAPLRGAILGGLGRQQGGSQEASTGGAGFWVTSEVRRLSVTHALWQERTSEVG